MTTPLTFFCDRGDGSRMIQFEHDGVRVQLMPEVAANQTRAMMLAERLRDAAEGIKLATDGYDKRVADAAARAAIAESKLALALSKIPPATPARLLGPGCVRERDGQLWLLADRVKGWSAFGFRLDSWDDLFRRYNVRVTECGSDEHGLYWTIV